MPRRVTPDREAARPCELGVLFVMTGAAAQAPLFGGGRSPRVAVIGGGFGGIAAGVYLKRAKVETFTIFEKSEGAGGTWWENRYPGAEVDSESHLYSFSFKLHDWTRTHA